MPATTRRHQDRALIDAVLRALAADTVSRATVAAHLPFGSEPGASATPSLPDALADAGFRVLLPVLLPDLDLDWAEHHRQGFSTTAGRGLQEPPGPRLGVAAISQTEAVVTPAAAVDRFGVRLGRGGGSYDRALARVSAATPVIALLYDGELVEQLPVEPHDSRVTAVITPSGGLQRLGRGSPP